MVLVVRVGALYLSRQSPAKSNPLPVLLAGTFFAWLLKIFFGCWALRGLFLFYAFFKLIGWLFCFDDRGLPVVWMEECTTAVVAIICMFILSFS